jgi:hypothetical protein
MAENRLNHLIHVGPSPGSHNNPDIVEVWSWASITKAAPHREDLIDLAFFAFVIFIAVSIAYRSSFWADRVVFGAVAGAFALIVVRAAFLSPAAICGPRFNVDNRRMRQPDSSGARIPGFA